MSNYQEGSVIMSRPKQCGYEESAKGKIESAFWAVLEKEGFRSVTMLRLAQESGLNRNTIYYHFGNVREIALFAFHHSLPDTASRLFINTVLSETPITSAGFPDSELLSHIHKIHLFARSGSALLNAIVKQSLKEAWFANAGVSEEMLTESDKMQIEYIVSGFISIIGSSRFTSDLSALKTFPDTLIGKAAVNTLKKIADDQARKNGSSASFIET